MNILVCGGAGFIGSTFVRRRLASTDDRIVVLDKLTYAGNRLNLADVESSQQLASRLRFAQGDIADAEAVGRLVRDVDAVVNFAAESHVDRSILDAADFLRTGVIGVHVLAEAARAQPKPVRLVQVSTDEVYGPVESGRSVESDPLAPRSPYAAAKAAGELILQSYRATHGLDVVITRGANSYGPYQHPEKLIPLFITNALADKELPLYGDGLYERDWLHVNDHADGVGFVLDHGDSGETYNLAAGESRTNRDVTERVLAHLGKPWSLVRSVPDRPGHDRRYAMDGSKIARLGWQPSIRFEDGLPDTVNWYRDNEAWWRAIQSDDWLDYYDRQYSWRLAASAPA
jgi:dTDP-glucose 4,6-dehydratase